MRKRIFSLAAVFVQVLWLYAQAPLNDECSGLVDLGVAPACPATVYTNVNATTSGIPAPTCFEGGTVQRDVWFSFTCPTNLLDWRITLSGAGANGMVNPEFAVYRGDCSPAGLSEILCAKAAPGNDSLFVDLLGLTPGFPYFIRVADYSLDGTPNWGDFSICVDSIPPIFYIDGGGSTLCSGVIYDTGGPDGNYGPNENHVFVICPANLPGCLDFTLNYFNIENSEFGLAEQLILYDGPNTNSPVLADIGGGDFTFTGIAGGGAACFQTQASSGCLTLEFVSNGFDELEGFMGTWNCSTAPCAAPDVPVVDNTTVSATTIVDAIASPSTQVTVVSIDCPTGAFGTFDFAGDPGPLGLDKGLLLTSGDAQLAVGPNINDDTGVDNESPGDADLNYLSLLQGVALPSFDACVIELDVYAAGKELSFEYVFGSDEYPEYVNTSFNDIFAFLVSGPGIAGDPNLGNAINVAVLPGTNTPVEINSVNNLLNWPYYRNTQISDFIEYDGLTIDSLGKKKTLTARIPVIPCNTYRLKLAIADRGDGTLDSGVFISDISGGTPELIVDFASGIDYLIEGCSGTADQLVISLSKPAEEPTFFVAVVEGTATPNVDYTLNLPDTIFFPAGVSSIAFPIVPILDTLVEGAETIVISLVKDFGCGPVVFSTVTINLNDDAVVSINAGADTLYLCAGATVQLHAEGASSYVWQPAGAVNNPFIANPTIAPTQNLWLQATGTIGSCSDVDSVYLSIIDPNLELQALADTNICTGNSVPLLAINNTGGQNLVWTPQAGLSDPGGQKPIASPTATTTYTATLAIPGCTLTDEVTINVDTLFLPDLIKDTTICQNFAVQLANQIQSTSSYNWSPGIFLSDSTVSGPVALPDFTVKYSLISTSANGYCADTAVVTVTVVPADIRIEAPDTIDICLGAEVPLQASVNPGGGAVQWTPALVVVPSTGTDVEAVPNESVTLFARYTVGTCIVTDSVRIRVDSLPDLTIFRQTDKPVYCPGDTVILFSPTYEPANFPDIVHQWLPAGQQETAADLLNMVITATDTLIFQRITQNRACLDTAEVQVNVEKLPVLTATALPPGVCPGGTAQLNASVAPQQKIEWSAHPTLSCTDCPDPAATPLLTTPYQVTTPDAICPATATVVVEVFPLPALSLPNDTLLCQGNAIRLNGTQETNVAYTWTSQPPGFASNDAGPVVSPLDATTYFVTAVGPQQCVRVGQVSINVVQGNVDAGLDQTICAGTRTSLSAVTSGTSGEVVWSPGNAMSQTIEVAPLVSTDFVASYTPGDGCTFSDTVRVNVFPAVQLSPLNAQPDSTDLLCEGAELRLSVTVMPADVALYWTQNGEVVPGATDTVLMVKPVGGDPDPIAYVYNVVATDLNGCTATATPYNVQYQRCLRIPNVFTPGNDDVNETFGLVFLPGGSVELLSFDLYNRWGQKVFEGSNAQDRWDGTVDGKPAPADVYLYVIKVRFVDGKEEVLHGDVTLLR